VNASLKVDRSELLKISKREELWKLDGPAPRQDKDLWKELALRNIKRRHIPPFLRNDILHTTKKDPLGRIQVKRMTGTVGGPATQIVRKFEDMLSDHTGENTRARENLEEKLLAVEDKLGEDEHRLIDLLRGGRKNKSLSTVFAEAGVRPSRILKLYAEGAIALGKVHSAIEVSRNQPMVVKDLLRHALDQERVCNTCLGTKLVKRNVNSKEENETCPACRGSGTRLVSSKHKPYAMEKVLQIGKLVDAPKKGTEVNVNQQVGIAVNTRGGGFMERILKTSDEVLYGRRTALPALEVRNGSGPIEAEVLSNGGVDGGTGVDEG
jgi:hypothetical protein